MNDFLGEKSFAISEEDSKWDSDVSETPGPPANHKTLSPLPSGAPEPDSEPEPESKWDSDESQVTNNQPVVPVVNQVVELPKVEPELEEESKWDSEDDSPIGSLSNLNKKNVFKDIQNEKSEVESDWSDSEMQSEALKLSENKGEYN